jgi:hypothetical protein
MTSKYDHLAAIGAEAIALTFAEVEAVIGPLPRAARYDYAWWGATASGRYFFAHVGHLQRVGYLADRPDFATQIVTFCRVAK